MRGWQKLLEAGEKTLPLVQRDEATVHGTFAEIGAGQEVVRWFFHVGGLLAAHMLEVPRPLNLNGGRALICAASRKRT